MSEGIISKKKTVVLSFDVGIRNLAYALLSVPRGSVDRKAMCIMAWDMIDLEQVSSVEQCCRRLTNELHARFGAAAEPVDVVLVEKQPKHRSIMMVAVQMFLCTYFHSLRAQAHPAFRTCSVRFMHAGRKLDVGPGPDGPRGRRARGPRTKEQAARYRENKAYSVAQTRALLEDVQDFANLALLEQYPKKDDLCDALLQAVAYLGMSGVYAAPDAAAAAET